MHHALVDGLAGARMISRWTTREPSFSENFAPLWARSKHKHKPSTEEHASSSPVHNLFEQIANPLRSAAGVLGAGREHLASQAG